MIRGSLVVMDDTILECFRIEICCSNDTVSAVLVLIAIVSGLAPTSLCPILDAFKCLY